MKPNLNVYITRTIMDTKTGKTIKKYRKRQARSFVKAFMQFMEIMTAHAYNVASGAVNITDTGGTPRSTSYSVESQQRATYGEAPANDSSYGIQIGTGTTAPAITDHTLETKIGHGVGAGQMQYGACSVQTAGVVGATMELNIVRTFINGSDDTITVKEVGWVVGKELTFFLWIRDAVDDAVANGQTYTVTYTLTTTV